MTVYTSRTAAVADPIALSFTKLADYPAIPENELEVGGKPIPPFWNGFHAPWGSYANRRLGNKPILYAEAFDSQDETFTGTKLYGVSHADHGLIAKGDVASRVQTAAECLDRGGNAVDPRKINIRDHQDAHTGTRD